MTVTRFVDVWSRASVRFAMQAPYRTRQAAAPVILNRSVSDGRTSEIPGCGRSSPGDFEIKI
jgi:hypothetical protein